MSKVRYRQFRELVGHKSPVVVQPCKISGEIQYRHIQLYSECIRTDSSMAK